MQEQGHLGVADPDQRGWILGELIRYLEDPRSGALEFDDMAPDRPAPAGLRQESSPAGVLRSPEPGYSKRGWG